MYRHSFTQTRSLGGCVGLMVILIFVLAGCGVSARAKTVTPSPSGPTASPTATAEPTAIPPTPTPTPMCGLTELGEGQHISSSCSYTQTETEAAGPMICRIQRNSCAYSYLIINRDPNIIFGHHKPAPYTAEDAMIHPAMLLPLTRLSELVTQEWGQNVHLMVTAAYDSLLEHDLLQTDPTRKYSLHFEGRSIDLVTYPVDPSRFPRLCALALYAGFDWVSNEGNHCHASIKADSLCNVCSGVAPTPIPTPTPFVFPTLQP